MGIHYLVLGATGPTGIVFCQKALEQGNSVTVLVRNPTRLPADVSEHANVKVIKGEFSDSAALESAAKSGASVFVSFAGPVMGSQGTPVSDCYRNLFPLLVQNGIRRALVLSTPSFPAPEDLGGWKWSASVALIKTLSNAGYREMHGIGEFVSAQPVDDVAWTIFRVGWLKNGFAGEVEATFTGSGKDALGVCREGIVLWVLRESVENKWVGKAPLLCNK